MIRLEAKPSRAASFSEVAQSARAAIEYSRANLHTIESKRKYLRKVADYFFLRGFQNEWRMLIQELAKVHGIELLSVPPKLKRRTKRS